MSSAKQESEFQRAFSEDGALKTHIGGQALLEGVMMRGKFNWAVAVREPAGGVYIEQHDLTSGKSKHAWMHWPLVRGCTALVESLALGFKALDIATEHAYLDDESEALAQSCAEGVTGAAPEACVQAEVQAEGGAQVTPLAPCEFAAAKNESACGKEAEGESFLEKYAMTISMIIGVLMGVALFIVVPAAVTNLIVGEYDSRTLLWNIVDGLLRVAIFVFYIWLIGRMKDIKRMFSYHGAEHKTIHCYEHGLELTPENARKFPRLHVRCGTAFMIMVMIIAIIVYTIVPLNALIGALGVPDGLPKLVLVIVSRIVLMPLIAGISYEITVKWAGSHPNNPLVKVILWPGMQMQRLTTNEPDDSMLECAIAAMQQVLEREVQENSAKI